MNPEGILLLAKWMSKGREIDDQYLDYLLYLDKLHEKVYQSHRIKAGFQKAQEMANIRVINAILLQEYKV